MHSSFLGACISSQSRLLILKETSGSLPATADPGITPGVERARLLSVNASVMAVIPFFFIICSLINELTHLHGVLHTH